MFLSRERIEPEPSQDVWAGNVEGTGANAKSWFDRLLAGMVEAGLGIPALSLYLSLAEPELLARIARLDLAVPHNRPMRRAGGSNPWTATEIRHLIQWWGEGIRVARIADALGRSKGGIYAKKRRLGLPSRDRKSLVDRDPLADAEVCLGAGVVVPHEECGSDPVTLAAEAQGAPTGEAAGSSSDEVRVKCGRAQDERRAVGTKRRENGKQAAPAALEETFLPKTEAQGPGSVRLGTASPELLAAIAEIMKLARRQTAGRTVDWSRYRVKEDEVLELALRMFAGQSRFAVARDMGISPSAAENRLSRLGVGSVREEWPMYGWKRDVEQFDVAVALERIRTSGASATVCQELGKFFYVGRQDKGYVRRCPDWHRNFSPEAIERKLKREEAARKKAAPENPSGETRKTRGASRRPASPASCAAEFRMAESRERYRAEFDRTFATLEAEGTSAMSLDVAA